MQSDFFPFGSHGFVYFPPILVLKNLHLKKGIFLKKIVKFKQNVTLK